VGHLVQPPCRSRVTYSRLHRILSRRVLNISREGDSTTSLGSLFQCSVTLRGKTFFPLPFGNTTTQPENGIEIIHQVLINKLTFLGFRHGLPNTKHSDFAVRGNKLPPEYGNCQPSPSQEGLFQKFSAEIYFSLLATTERLYILPTIH